MTAAMPTCGNPVWLHRGQSFNVARCQGDQGKSFILKQLLETNRKAGMASARLRSEARILERLAGVEGCPAPIRFDPAAGALYMEDFGGADLVQAGLPGQIDLPLFLDIARQLAGHIAALHAHRVIHKDLNPTNIIYRPSDGRVQVIDFDISSTFAEERPDFEHPSRLLGTPSYLSPEQSGRMNLPVDYRTDLYSLGATLYALATGQPPFGEGDALEMIHAHLALAPEPPERSAPWLPPALSELILKLLAKAPDQRYQSATGLAHDLDRIAEGVRSGRPMDAGSLGRMDVPLTPRPPSRLYGREREQKALLDAFAEVGAGAFRAVVVSGYSGVGKTSLIQQIHRPATLSRGLFASGKFEQYQQSRPFHAPSQALQQLCELLLAESEETLGHWRERLLSVLGEDASALFEVVPALESVLGPQPPVERLGALEAQIRLRTLLVALIGAVAEPAHPLVLFFDDLQWADTPSLDLIAALADQDGLQGLLLIGAYRDNEVDEAHPLAKLLRDMAGGADGRCLLSHLDNLTEADLAKMMADMLRGDPGATLSLAEAVYGKTGGNPFFTVEFLNALFRQGALRPDPATNRWAWDLEAIRLHAASDNVIDFLSEQLDELEAPTLEVLAAAAGFGAEFPLGTLAVACGLPAAEAAARLSPALERGIVVTPDALSFLEAVEAAPVRFCHDRMQQAVYQHLPEPARLELHLELARNLHRSDSRRPECRLRAAEQYAVAAGLVSDAAERGRARGLFFEAARHARGSGAFATARRYLEAAIRLLPEDSWREAADETFTLHAELHLVLYSLSLYAACDEVYAQLARHAPAPLALIEPACVQVDGLSNRVRYAEAIELADDLLRHWRLAPPDGDVHQAVDEELDRLYAHIEAGALDRLRDQADIEDAGLAAAAKLMTRVLPVSFFIQPMLAFWFNARLFRLWIEVGYCPAAVLGPGQILAPMLLREDYQICCRSNEVALQVAEERGLGWEAGRLHHSFGLFYCQWYRPMEDAMPHERIAFEKLVRSGDLQFACYTYFTTLAVRLETGDDLKEMEEELAAALRFTKRTHNAHAEQSYLSFRQLVRALEGKTSPGGSFADTEFDEAEHLQRIAANPMALAYYHIYRAVGACLFDDDASLAEHAAAGVALIPYIISFHPTALAHFMRALSLARALATAPDRQAVLADLEASRTWLIARAAEAPMNFGHMVRLVDAERDAALGRVSSAIDGYERAVRLARANHRPWHHALATERYGRYCLSQGLDTAGQLILGRAHDLYLAWGATGKVQAMEDEWSFLGGRRTRTGSSSTDDALDRDALLRASQAISSETTQASLLAKVIEVLAQMTGAGEVLLLTLGQNDHMHLYRRSGATPLEPKTVALRDGEGDIPVSVVRLALRTGQRILSEDAVIDRRFAADAHFAGMKQCSLLGMPVRARGDIGAFLILENRLARAAFNPFHAEAASVIAGQLAISLENARVYQSLERLVEARTRELEDANHRLAALSNTDGLTELANRRRFDELLAKEWMRARRQGTALGIIMLDVDLFKNYNDRYGHQAGDDCLRRIASVLTDHARRSGDLAARYGGEEFTLILPEVDAAGLAVVAEDLRSAVEAMAIPHIDSPPGHVTVSIGAATAGPDSSAESLLRRADQALYASKQAGRNRVTLATETPPD